MGDITGFIFAAGLGTRLRPLTYETPKPLLKVHGKPMLEYTLDLMKKLGITEVVVNAFHLKEQFTPYNGNYKDTVTVTVSYEDEILGHSGGMVKALSLIKNDIILAVNGDTILDFDPAALEYPLKRIRESINPYHIEIAVTKDVVNPLSIVDEMLIGIGDKMYESAPKAKIKNENAIGLYLIKKSALELIKPEDGFMGIYGKDDLTDRMHENNGVAYTFTIPHLKRYEITTPEDLEHLNSIPLRLEN